MRKNPHFFINFHYTLDYSYTIFVTALYEEESETESK